MLDIKVHNFVPYMQKFIIFLHAKGPLSESVVLYVMSVIHFTKSINTGDVSYIHVCMLCTQNEYIMVFVRCITTFKSSIILWQCLPYSFFYYY